MRPPGSRIARALADFGRNRPATAFRENVQVVEWHADVFRAVAGALPQVVWSLDPNELGSEYTTRELPLFGNQTSVNLPLTTGSDARRA